MKKRITFISDTHTKHEKITSFLTGGDILIHGGDFMSSGYNPNEAEAFFTWFNSIEGYDTKIFIAGNHDRIMQDDPQWAKGALTGYKTIDYLQDDELVMYFDGVNGDEPESNIHIWGTPWQPEFRNWAFNLPRGKDLKEKWDMIPTNTDILITHAPPFGKLDYVEYDNINAGCEELMKRISTIKPKINIFGHIHGGYGYVFDGNTHYINAAVLNDRYEFRNKPVTVDWDPETNELEFINL
jgi:calcineurin-like phosphoesterase family protein